MALMIMILFLLITGCNDDRLLMKNSLFSAPETPLGPSRNVNSMVTQRWLSSSSNSPGVGHMQMTRRKYEDIMKSHQSHGEDQVKQKRKTKQKLGSSPSLGDGN